MQTHLLGVLVQSGVARREADGAAVPTLPRGVLRIMQIRVL